MESPSTKTLEDIRVKDINPTANSLARMHPSEWKAAASPDAFIKDVVEKLGYEAVEIVLETRQRIEEVDKLGDFVMTPNAVSPPLIVFNINSTDDIVSIFRDKLESPLSTYSLVINSGKNGIWFGGDNNGHIFFFRKRVQQEIAAAYVYSCPDAAPPDSTEPPSDVDL